MLKVIENILLVLSVLTTTLASLRFIHMMQLESYQPKMYIKWLKRNVWKDWLPTILIFVICTSIDAALPILVNSSFLNNVQYNIVTVCIRGLYAILMGYIAFTWRRLPSKKPLVYTGRVKRLIAAVVIFIWLIYLYPARIRMYNDMIYSVYITARMSIYIPGLILPLLVLVATWATYPIEEGIKRWYFNQAKRILESRTDLIKIGITGSYGKTTCKFILGTILNEKYNVCITPRSYNTPMGITRVVREQLLPEHEVFIAEMGARYAGDIDELCDLVAPSIGWLTAVGKQHMETFGSQEDINNTKYELIASLPSEGAAFFNGDNQICVELSKRIVAVKEKLSYGLNTRDEVYMRAVDVTVGPQGSVFTLIAQDGQSIECFTRLLGAHNILNITGAATIARYMGLTMQQIANGIRRIEPVEHRLQLIPGAVTVIDDAFNANPDGARAAMEVLRGFPGRRIVVTPGMVELGEEEDEQNRILGELIAQSADFAILVGKKRALQIKKGMEDQNFDTENIFVVNSLEEATAVLGSLTKPKDVVLFENDLPDNYTE